MSKNEKGRMKVAGDLVRKGATIIAEPCPQCGGVQLRYLGKVHCTSHEDLTMLMKVEGASEDTVMAELREVLLSRLKDGSRLLETEIDPLKQEQLVGLLNKSLELLMKLPKKRQSP